MATIISTKTSGVGGLTVTGDASGVLQLASANGTTAVTIDASQNVTFANTLNVPNTFGFKNRIINGGMVIDQRNAGASVTPVDGQYTVDRWRAGLTQAGKYIAQQTSGNGFGYSLGVTSTSAYSVLTGDFFTLQQMIEGFNFADMQWGTANASTVTLSFTVRSSLTGTFGGALRNSAGNRSYPFSYSISVANTWTTISITIAGDTTGTWLGATNGIGCRLLLSLGAGSTYSGTAGAWSGSTLLSATGAVSIVGTSGATFYITGVQLEKGSTATSFDQRAYGTELALCQRYYEIGSAYLGAYTSLGANYPIGMLTGTNFQNTKRAAPTVAVTTTASSNIYTNIGNTGNINTSSFSSVGLVTTQNVFGNITITWTASAEL